MTQGLTQDRSQLETELGRVDPDAFADDLEAGHSASWRHTIEGFLNSGGFGITYLARDSPRPDRGDQGMLPERLVPPVDQSGPARRANTRAIFAASSKAVAEAKSLARLVHPNIVGVHQVFEDNDTAYMAIDYIDGRDLHDILDSTDQAFTPDQVVAMLKKMLSAVEFIHQVGILHRDISPINILVDRTGNLILIDFGAASEQVVRAPGC